MEKPLFSRESMITVYRSRLASKAKSDRLSVGNVYPDTWSKEETANLNRSLGIELNLRRWSTVMPNLSLSDQLRQAEIFDSVNTFLNWYFQEGNPVVIDCNFLEEFPVETRWDVYMKLGRLVTNVVLRDIDDNRVPRKILSYFKTIQKLSLENIQIFEFKEVPQHYVKELRLVNCRFDSGLLDNWLCNLGEHLELLHIEQMDIRYLHITNQNLKSLTLIGELFNISGFFDRLEYLKIVTKRFYWRQFLLGHNLKEVYSDAPPKIFTELESMRSLTVRWWHGLRPVSSGPPQRFKCWTKVKVLTPVFPEFKEDMDRLRSQCIVEAVDYEPPQF